MDVRKHRNAVGVIAFVASMLDIVILVLSIELPVFLPAVIPLSILAVVLGIVALVLRAKRSATAIVLPIIGLVFAVLVALVASVASAGALALHPVSEGTKPVVFPDNSEMTTMFMTTFTIERGIRAQMHPYGWPTARAPDAEGRIYLGGKLIATLGAGETMSYLVMKGGEDFELKVYGKVPTEYISYEYDSHVIIGNCLTADPTCVEQAS